MSRTKWRVVMGVVLVTMCIAGSLSAEEPASELKETVLDRKVHIEKEVILDIPDVPRLCDAMDVSKQRVDIGGGRRLYCELEGKGLPVVLLHGGPGCTHHVFHPEFSRASRFARVVYYDQRGCGLSDYEEGEESSVVSALAEIAADESDHGTKAGYSVDQAAADLDKLRGALGIDKWVVLGHSYGGTLAQDYLVHYPEHTAGLVLVCSAEYGLGLLLKETRQYDFLAPEERERIDEVFADGSLSLDQRLFNAQLNGDWKRQSFCRPSREQLARLVRYEWQHDDTFRGAVIESLAGLDFVGVFDQCPVPVLIMESRWDLTWNKDKPEKLHACFPGSKLVLFERAGHSPFQDVPVEFFAALEDFVAHLPSPSADAVSRWKEHVAALEKERVHDPRYLLAHAGYGRRSNASIAEAYTEAWLEKVQAPDLLLKTGFALYDMGNYEAALEVFRKMEERARDNKLYSGIALVWQGHMLDLTGRREQAIPVYQKVVDMNLNDTVRHDQFGLAYAPTPYAAERIQTPFVRVENNDAD